MAVQRGDRKGEWRERDRLFALVAKVHGNGLVEKKKKEEEKKAEEKAQESTAELRKRTRNLQSHGLKRR